MKKLLGVIFALVLSLTAFAACGGDKSQTFTMYVPDGAPLLAVAKLAAEDGGVGFGLGKTKDKIKSEIVTGAQIGPALFAKTPDFALAPINVCATAYNKTGGEYVLCGVSVWGLNHIVSKNENVRGLSDLVGETIYAFQESGTPGITLKTLIKAFDLEYKILTEDDKTPAADKINIMFLAQPADVRNALTVGIGGVKATHGVLSEPLVTAIKTVKDPQNEAEKLINSSLDTQKLWTEKFGKSYPQVGLLVRKSLCSDRYDDVNNFIDYLENISVFVRENPAEIAELATVTLESTGLPAAKVCENFIASESGQAAFAFGKTTDAAIKESVENYLDKLTKETGDLSIVGGKLPTAEFYLAAK